VGGGPRTAFLGTVVRSAGGGHARGMAAVLVRRLALDSSTRICAITTRDPAPGPQRCETGQRGQGDEGAASRSRNAKAEYEKDSRACGSTSRSGNEHKIRGRMRNRARAALRTWHRARPSRSRPPRVDVPRVQDGRLTGDVPEARPELSYPRGSGETKRGPTGIGEGTRSRHASMA